jgi:hypothetical protein
VSTFHKRGLTEEMDLLHRLAERLKGEQGFQNVSVVYDVIYQLIDTVIPWTVDG